MAAGLVVLVAVAGLPVYVFPPAATIEPSDVVYVIGPPTKTRMQLAQRLLDDGMARQLLVSVPSDWRGLLDVCADDGATCESPHPFTTKGEALLLTKYAQTHEASKTIVITFTPHVARTRFIFAKCYGGDVTVVGVDEHLTFFDWVHQYAYQTAAFAKAILRPCPASDD